MENTQSLESLRARFQAEHDRRISAVDPNTVRDLAGSISEIDHLLALARDHNQPSEIRLDACRRGLDFTGLTAKAARYREHDPAELTLSELNVAPGAHRFGN